MEEINLKNIIDDISAIKRVLQITESRNAIASGATKANISIQITTLVTALTILAIEVIFGQPARASFIYSASNYNFMLSGLLNAGMFLLVASSSMYFFIKLYAKKENNNIEDYIAENFSYLKNFAFFTDLLIKYAIFSLIIYAKKPELISLLFTLYTADYLFQGKFFQLPLKLELALALVCLAVSGVIFYQNISSLIPALSVFCIANFLSVIYSQKSLKQKSEI